jgi:hypothetical protein
MQQSLILIQAKNRLYQDSARLVFFGFDECFDCINQLASMLHLPGADVELKGTEEQYAQYWAYMKRYETSAANKRTWFDPGTPEAVRKALDVARLRGRRLRLWIGDMKTGRDWMEQDNVIGYIGRSPGPMRRPTLLKSRLSRNGQIISTINLVRIMDIRDRKEVYRHSEYYFPRFTQDTDTYKVAPFFIRDMSGETITRFETATARQRWIEFMEGKRFTIK